MWLSDVSVKRPVVAVVLSLLLCVFGVVSFSKLAVREMPDIESPVVTVMTTYEGTSATVMESQVTTPIEDELSGISGIDNITSITRNGMSRITIEFDMDWDLTEGVSDVRDAVARAQRRLPDDANDPMIKVMYVKLKPELMAGRGVTTQDIVNALKDENVELPGGEVRNDQTVMSVRTARLYRNADDFKYLVVRTAADGTPVYLKDIADVAVGAENENSTFKSNGVVNLSLGIVTMSDANPLNVAKDVRMEVERMQKFLPQGTQLTLDYDATVFIERSMDLGEALDFLDQQSIELLPKDITIDYAGESKDFRENQSSIMMVFGLALLVAYLVLAAQFESFVNPLVVMLTVPMGIFGGLAGLWIMGQGLNIYSQIGMIMLIGMVTKNGILIVEFANQLRDKGTEFEQAIIDASVRRLRPILMTAFTTLFGALPLILSTGAGSESRIAVGTVVFFGMAFATLVTLLVIPAMYRLLSAKTKSPGYVEAQLEKELEQEYLGRMSQGNLD
ncbi:hypothetical protein DA099_09105 [Photobacterium damselae]|uniref:efflux RND transporter permease subunit n=1 Tax=Photobacterium damselae TaxID=38293 RepID=UPI001110BCC6|nr:efflux RND transporter permease subunit [Photobacterium damselae]TMX50448.1 hypothetical protein DA099_09105 [Photobacterium damselae]